MRDRLREAAANVLTWGGWAFGVVAYLKYLVMDTDQTGPMHFVAFGCWLFLGALTLRRHSTEVNVTASSDATVTITSGDRAMFGEQRLPSEGQP
jgi:hypothetical protein